jgi:hypothetical protein
MERVPIPSKPSNSAGASKDAFAVFPLFPVWNGKRLYIYNKGLVGECVEIRAIDVQKNV